MNPTAELPAWRILPAQDGHFSWGPIDGHGRSLASERLTVLIPRGSTPESPRIPSMSELLTEASPKLRGGDGGEDSVPMFKTASGRSVTVKQSSLQKAETILDGSYQSGGYGALSLGNSGESGLPMFCTGSGKLVKVSKSSLEKAASMFKLELPKLGHRELLEGDAGGVGFPMLRSASGASVNDRGDMLDGQPGVPMFQNGLGRPIGLKHSSMKKALSILKEEEFVEAGRSKISNPTAGLGIFVKPINVAEGGDQRASELLGLDENDFTFSKRVVSQSCHDTVTGRRKSGEQLMNTGSPGMCLFTENLSRNPIKSDGVGKLHVSNMHESAPMSHQIEFHMASGRSLPISDAALRRARILLADDDTEKIWSGSSTSYSVPSVSNDGSHRLMSHDKENFQCIDNDTKRRRNMLTVPTQEPSLMPALTSERGSKFDGKMLHAQNTFKDENLRIGSEGWPPRPPLANITNRESSNYQNQVLFSGEKRRQRRASSISPFKRPRNSRFSTPLRLNNFLLDTGQTCASDEVCCQKLPLSSRYPSPQCRRSIIENFKGPPQPHMSSKSLPDEVRHISPDKAAAYRFNMSSECEGTGADEFQDLLIQAGASSLNATKEWVRNHYKWIVWKLACLERGYPEQAKGKYLTVVNVLEELKYRYEREVNHGHRSAVKRILDGDASPSSMLVLCVSAIHPLSNADTHEIGGKASKHDADDDKPNADARRIELTDGWYSLNANLDANLSYHLASGKMFVGQKLRIWGATLVGWAGPVTSLEAWKSVSLQLHINGTYRAHWAARLGFCKGFRFPLAFRCIKGGGGQVPKTLVGVMRIYPVLYKERFSDGGSIVRSERMESKILHLHNQRRLLIAEDIMTKQDKLSDENEDDSEEGAEILKILETSAEPEVLMAGMSSQQLISISNYQAKQEAMKQNAIVKKIEKALEDAGLGSREVTPFLRVRVVGLNPKGSSRRGSALVQGLVTIWNPTELQRVDLAEGHLYAVSGLTPLVSGPGFLHLQARGPTSNWKPLPSSAGEQFEPFFNPRHPALLATLGELPLSSEFDVAAAILHVGEVFSAGHQKKQWVFVSDGSHEEHHYCVLAVSLCLPSVDPDRSVFLHPNLAGSTVCFYNLVKRARDEPNHLWVAEATENSVWSQSGTVLGRHSHLKEAAARVKKWADGSPSALRKLREKVVCIVDGECGD